MKVEWVPIGELLDLQRRAVDVRTESIYQEIGVRSFGRGLFIKPPLVGAELGDKRVFEIHEGDFVVSNVFAWEGAVGVATKEHDGLIGSHRFMTWTPRRDVSVEYLRHYFGSEAGVASLGKASPGSAGRNRTLSIKNFKRLLAPLPERTDQDRIAAHLGELEHRLSVTKFDPADLVDPAVAGWLNTLPSASLSELAEVCPRPKRVEPATAVDFIPMDAVDATTGAIVSPVTRARGELTSGYRQFLPGDVIFARITPSMQNGKSAIYRGNAAEVGYGSTEFHVLRPYDELYAEWLWALLRTSWFISRAMRAFTGTAGQQRVPASFLEGVTIPVPPSDELAAATRRLLQLRDRVNELAAALGRREHLATAILPAARNDIFNLMR